MSSVAIVCPIYDRPELCFTDSMDSILRQDPEIEHWYAYGMPSNRRARNHLAHWFLTKSRSDWMLMVDSDMKFSIDDLKSLLSREKPLIGGLYRKREKSDTPFNFVLNTLDGKPFNPELSDVQEVKYTGTGFLLIHRNVFESMRTFFKGFPTIGAPIDYFSDTNEGSFPMWDFFFEGIRDGRLLSCDWGFCQRWHDMRQKVYVDCKTNLLHCGRQLF